MSKKYTITLDTSIAEDSADWIFDKKYQKNSLILTVDGAYQFMFEHYTKAKTIGIVEIIINNELKSTIYINPYCTILSKKFYKFLKKGDKIKILASKKVRVKLRITKK